VTRRAQRVTTFALCAAVVALPLAACGGNSATAAPRLSLRPEGLTFLIVHTGIGRCLCRHGSTIESVGTSSRAAQR